MSLEIEVKYPVTDFSPLLSRLAPAGRLLSARHFERNLVLDTEDRSLLAKGMLLRLRGDGEATFTLKVRPEPNPYVGYKVRREIETSLGDLEAMREALELLGFKSVLRYEKYREIWAWLGCKVFLDELCFGLFVEIEGEPKAIEACAAALGLDPATASPENYHELHRKFLLKQGLPLTDSFIFAQSDEK